MSMQISISNSIGGIAGAQVGGTPTPPPFSNVNSFSFDGVDDYFMVPNTSGLSFGNGTTDLPFSISAWIKIGQTTAQGIVTKYGSSSSTREYLFYTTGGKLRLLFIDASNGANNFATGTTNLSTNTWYHVSCTYDGRGGSTAYNGITLYINGVAESVTTSGGSYTAMSNTSQRVEIGKYSTNELLGNIDETAIFTTELSASDVLAIYNNGEPQSLDAYSPFVWFRMGDNATWNGATWTMTSVGTDTRIARSINMVEANRTTDVPTASTFSNTKSIALDGVDDFVEISNATSFNDTADFSISAWLKFTSSASTKNALNIRDDRYLYISGGKIFGAYKNASAQFRSIQTSLTYNDGNWHHVLFVKNSTNMILFVDGTQVAINSNGGATRSGGTIYARIGSRAFTSTPSNFFDGSIDEMAYFTSDQSTNVTTIYNGGEPNDLTSLSPLSWWRCGDGDTAPTLTDNGSGGNDGTMTNFSTFSTDVPTASTFSNTRSIALDGIDDFVDIGNPNNLSTITSISISAWFKTTDTVGGLVIVGSDDNAQGRRYILRTENSSGIKLRFFSFSSNNSFNDIIGTTNINDGQWHHVLAINNGTNLKIYIDGVLDNSNTNGNLINTTFATPDINIGRRSYSGVEGYFDGYIDEVAIWSSDQSANASDIGGTIPTDLSTYNPLGWWRCGDGDTSPTLTDNGSGGNDGTMTNFSTFSTDVPT